MPADGPLAGIRVVECASIVLGPLTGQHLADMGADVIKVEPPEGDLTRRVGPEREPGMGALFLACNRNKRSIVLDLKQEADRAVLHRLTEGCDVFLTSIRPAAAARLGVAYAELVRHRPDLVYCQVEGFGQAGPYASRAAYDDIIQALSGLAALQTVAAGEPRYVPSILADKITAVHAAYAVALGLLHRQRTGRGQEIHVPMFETVTAFTVVEHLWGHTFAPPAGDLGYPVLTTAARRPFRTADGYVALLPYSDRDWRRFYELIGRPDRAADPRFTTMRGRQENLAFVWGDLAERLAERTTAEWTALLADQDIAFSPVNSLADLLTDPQLSAVDFWRLLPDSGGAALRMPVNPIDLRESPASLRRLPPRLGEHTAQLRAELDGDSSGGRHPV